MRFLCQAAFWCAVVAAFMPRELSDEQTPRTLASSSTPVIDAAATLNSLCTHQPDVCAAGGEAAALARQAGLFAAERAVVMLSESRAPAS